MEHGTALMASPAEQFLMLTQTDDGLRAQLRGMPSEDLAEAAVKLAAERGLVFSSAELEDELARQLGLEEHDLLQFAPPTNCSSASGCRTPSLYCNY
ncbi:Nif11-like leader peptide family natural product precursor [Planobispora takensis]|uniref:Nif11 domain-containing protein n=1 Tax=Planobispora takensis TaxID=1367882 RepID=A0A8J3T6Z5_9ACTN|nr:Nif11-like leader peptide family natural product precursor [Planobispora takensis]GII05340.1 hypothetical protein Pta02_73480 [Planobispora takensis]